MWFKVSDDFPSHPKVKRASKILGGEPRRARGRIAAVWLEAGTWCSKYLTNGTLPKETLEDFILDPRPDEVASALVWSGLWYEEGESYRFHDWAEHNPAAEGTKAQRKDQALTRLVHGVPGLVSDLRRRDVDRCRYCGRLVQWQNRRGDSGGTYALLDASGAIGLDNVVVCCRRCRGRIRNGKGSDLELLTAGSAPPRTETDDGAESTETVNLVRETRLQLSFEQFESVRGTIPEQIPEQFLSNPNLSSRACARARSRPVPSRPRSQDPEKPRGLRRARPARMAIYELHEVQPQLHKAIHEFIELGPPYVDTNGPVIGEIVESLGVLAVQSLKTVSPHKRDLVALVEAVVARREARAKTERIRHDRDRRALRKLGRGG